MKRSRPVKSTEVSKHSQPQKRQKTDKTSSSKLEFTRPGKTDFTPLYKKHRADMIKAGCDMDAMITLRHKIHEYPEGSFAEVNTRQTIRDTLLGFGVDKKCFKECAKTGLIVDIWGTGPKKSNRKVKTIAIRAELDALPIPENNKSLPYVSKTSHAHMCGHDGHMAILLSAAQVIQKHRSRIPSNQKVRLLFQPAEETLTGAKVMVDEGCMNSVDEVYGLHNIPNFDEGDIRVRSGTDWAQASIVKIKITGKGGHGSTPHQLIDPISCMHQVYEALHTIKSRNIDSRQNCTFTICHFEAGTTCNVFPDEANMQGMFKSYNDTTHDLISNKIKTITENIAAAMECKSEVKIPLFCPGVVNHEEQTAHVKRLTTTHFGPQHFCEDELPTSHSEDFSYFLQKKPGCFFILGLLKPGMKPHPLHTSDFNFNDDMVATGGWFWVKLVEDRLQVSLM